MRAVAVIVALTLFCVGSVERVMAFSSAEISMITAHDEDGNDTQNFSIDTKKDLCVQNGDSTLEPFAETTVFKFTVKNNLSVSTILESFSFRVRRAGAGTVFKGKDFSLGHSIASKSESDVILPFAFATENDDRKAFIGSIKELEPTGHNRVKVTLNFRDGRGIRWSLKKNISLIFAEVNRCPA